MIYLLNIQYFESVPFYHSGNFLYKLYDELCKIDKVLILYKTSYKALNNSDGIKNKYGFNVPSRLDFSKIKQNIILHTNIQSYINDNIGEMYKLIDFCDNENKDLIILLSTHIYHEESHNIINYVKDNNIKNITFSDLIPKDKINTRLKIIKRNLKITKLLN